MYMVHMHRCVCYFEAKGNFLKYKVLLYQHITVEIKVLRNVDLT